MSNLTLARYHRFLYNIPPSTVTVPFRAGSVQRLDPLHQREPSGIADRAGGEHPLHQKQRGGEEQHLERREMVGEGSKQADLIEYLADNQTARRPQSQRNQQRDPHIVQALKGQHAGQLPVAHAHGLEHAELLLAGEQIGNQGVGKVDEGKYKDKD